jgi:hypothetical protein
MGTERSLMTEEEREIAALKAEREKYRKATAEILESLGQENAKLRAEYDAFKKSVKITANHIQRTAESITQLSDKNAKLRAALEEIASLDNRYGAMKFGDIARRALEESK